MMRKVIRDWGYSHFSLRCQDERTAGFYHSMSMSGGNPTSACGVMTREQQWLYHSMSGARTGENKSGHHSISGDVCQNKRTVVVARQHEWGRWRDKRTAVAAPQH